MNKNSLPSKSDYVQFRTDPEFKKLANEIADKFFGGNKSAMFRWLLYHFLPEMESGNGAIPANGNNFTSLSDDEAKWLEKIYEGIQLIYKEIHAIGNNTNQVAHHVNTQAMTHPSPVTKESAENIKGINTNLSSIRTYCANIWKGIKTYITQKSNTDAL